MSMWPDDELHAAAELEGGGAHDVLGAACEAAGVDLQSATLVGVHHRSGQSVSRVYESVTEAGEEKHASLLVVHVDLRSFPAGALVLARGRTRCAVWRFPNDPYLPGLASALDEGRVRELLDQLGVPAGRVALRVRAYRPARRAVVEVGIDSADTGGTVLYFKLLAGNRASELAAVHRALESFVRIPGVVGVAPDQGILVLEALAGVPLGDALIGGLPLPEPAEIVEVSTRLAASRLKSRRDPRGFADQRRNVPALSRLVPDRAEKLARLAHEAARVTGSLVPVHGDLHHEQLLVSVSGSICGLLDVDGAGIGYIAQDAGSLVAHLESLGEHGPHVAERSGPYANAIAEAYRPVVGADPLRCATAGAWLGLATGPHRAQQADWETRTRKLIDRAVRALEAG